MPLGTQTWDSRGWWNSISAITFQAGEMPSYALGNVGENSRYKASQDKPLEIHFADFDKNGSVDPVIFQYFGDTIYPLASRNQLVGQVSKWKNKFLEYRQFARIGRDQFFDHEEIRMATILQANEFKSGLLKNFGDSVHFEPFPRKAQISRIFGMQEIPEGIFAVGNFYGNETVTGRNDSGRGALLKSQIDILNEYEYGRNVGLEVSGESRSVAKLMGADGREIILVTRYNQSLLAFRSVDKRAHLIQMAADDQHLLIYTGGKPTLKHELFYGSGYLSQSSRKQALAVEVDSVISVDYLGRKRRVIF